MTAALLHDHEIPSRETSTTTPTSDERDDFMQRAAGRGRKLSKAGISGIITGGLVVGGVGISLGQEAQRNAIDEIHTTHVTTTEQTAENYKDDVSAAMNEQFAKKDVIGQAFNLEDQNDIYGHAARIYEEAGGATSGIGLEGIVISSNILASEVPQPSDEFNVVKTDVDHDGQADVIVVKSSHINQ